jgi:L-threonylcarbamoyladenylate synthase
MQSQTFNLKNISDSKLKSLGEQIKNGAVAVIPTDTIYGIVSTAFHHSPVEKVYKLRKRTSSKPMIILIESEKQIKDLGVDLSEEELEMLSKLWPAPLSVVVDADIKKLNYLHRGKKSLAFRKPDNEFLLKLLKISGPIVAPSANFEGEDPALNITDAKRYFSDSIAFYIDGGVLKSKPSTVAQLKDGKLIVLREGAAKIPAKFLK